MAYGQGAAAALPVVANFLKKVYADKSLGYDPEENFEIPQEISSAWLEAQEAAAIAEAQADSTEDAGNP